MGGVALGVAAMIGASTLFVKQHYFVDVAGGFIIAYAAYHTLIAPVPTSHLTSSELRYPRRYSLALPLLYTVAVSCAYIAYRQGWRPWEG